MCSYYLLHFFNPYKNNIPVHAYKNNGGAAIGVMPRPGYYPFAPKIAMGTADARFVTSRILTINSR